MIARPREGEGMAVLAVTPVMPVMPVMAVMALIPSPRATYMLTYKGVVMMEFSSGLGFGSTRNPYQEN